MTRFGRSGIARFDQIVRRPHPGEICGLTPLRVAMAGTSGRPLDAVAIVFERRACGPLALSSIALTRSAPGPIREIPSRP